MYFLACLTPSAELASATYASRRASRRGPRRARSRIARLAGPRRARGSLCGGALEMMMMERMRGMRDGDLGLLSRLRMGLGMLGSRRRLALRRLGGGPR